jgi:beta-lactamase class D
MNNQFNKSKGKKMKNEFKNKLRMFILVMFLMLGAFPAHTAFAQSEQDNWQPIFEKAGVNGTFLLFDMETEKFQSYNHKRIDSAFLPASTFKILNSLIALETKAVKDENDTIKWDGVDRGWDEWNKDQTMKTAMPVSCVWFYQALARRVGEPKMQMWLDSVGYGNCQIGTKVDDFWLQGDLKISAKEQVMFLKKLINNELPFSIHNQELVKKIMITDSTDSYVLHSKTGWGARLKKQIGWFVGYIETDGKTWIFAINIDIKNKSDLKYRQEIAYEILKQQGLIK